MSIRPEQTEIEISAINRPAGPGFGLASSLTSLERTATVPEAVDKPGVPPSGASQGCVPPPAPADVMEMLQQSSRAGPNKGGLFFWASEWEIAGENKSELSGEPQNVALTGHC